MRRTLMAVVAGSLILISCFAVNVSAADTKWSKGNFWEYSWGGTEEGMTIAGTMKMEVTKTVSVTVGGHSENAFVVEMTGDGTLSGTFLTTTATGTIALSGSETRLESNFSLVSTELVMTMAVQATGMSVSMSMGITMASDPPMMDLPFHENLTLGASFESSGMQTGSTWTNIMGTNESTPMSDSFSNVVKVASTSVSVTVAAGTFDCIQLDDMAGVAAQGSGYFSPKVGNFVKVTTGVNGSSFGPTALGDMQLKDYSYGSSGGVSMMMVIIIIVVVVAAVAAVAVLLAMRARKGPPAMMPQQMAPPSTYGPPPPPPAPPGP